MAKNSEEPQLFVWRDWIDQRYESRLIWKSSLRCVYCDTPLVESSESQFPEEQDTSIDTCCFIGATCCRCGWIKRKWTSWHTDMPGINSGRWITQRGLKKFNLSDPRIAIKELASHINRNYSDIYNINPRRFEELIAGVFAEQGWKTRLTKSTRDGGVDIYLLEESSGKQAIVECKRFRGKVGIALVDRLLGVQLAEGIETAYFVTSSEFTSRAEKRVNSPQIAKFGFQLNLIDAEELTKALSCFNEVLPPLSLVRKMKG